MSKTDKEILKEIEDVIRYGDGLLSMNADLKGNTYLEAIAKLLLFRTKKKYGDK